MPIRAPQPKKVTRADGTVAWTIRVDVGTVDGRRRQQLKTFRTEEEAADAIQDIQSAVRAKIHVTPSKLTVQNLVDDWMGGRDPNEKPATRLHYEVSFRCLLERHGATPVQKLTHKHLIALRDDMRAGKLRKVGTPGKPLSPRSVNAALSAIHGLLEYALVTKVVASNEAHLLLVPRAKKERTARKAVAARRGSWQLADAIAFLGHVQGDRLAACWWLTMVGMRRGEVLGLRWSDIDFDAATISIENSRTIVGGVIHEDTPKSEASERVLVNVPAEILDELRALKDLQAIEAIEHGPAYTHSPLVAVDVLGRPLRPEGYTEKFAQHVKAAGLPAITLHGARHCAASVLAAEGFSLPAVAEWLGQSQISVTEGYVHALTASKAAVGAGLGRLLGARGTTR